MYCVYFLVIVSVAGCLMHPLSQHEPKCHSRFDYDEKLLSKLIRMEMTMETVLSRMEQNEKTTDLAVAEMEQSALDMDISFKTQKEAAESALTAAVEKAELAVAAMQKRYQSSLKSNVLFHVKDVSPQPISSNTIKFTTVVQNVGGGYSKATGCFTAPAPGVYWFSAQICTHTEKNIGPSIYVRGELVSRVYVWDKDWGACGSVTTVSELEVGDEVCLKSGPIQAAGPVWSDDRYNSNNFMGALIN